MTTKTALFALLTVWGVGTAGCLPAAAEDAVEAGFTDRAWTREDDDRPGIMRIFLSDGTLVQDSCWETYRLSQWQLVSETSVRWNEDGMDIDADIVALSAERMTLALKLAGGEVVEETYVAAEVPFVCPDLPR